MQSSLDDLEASSTSRYKGQPGHWEHDVLPGIGSRRLGPRTCVGGMGHPWRTCQAACGGCRVKRQRVTCCPPLCYSQPQPRADSRHAGEDTPGSCPNITDILLTRADKTHMKTNKQDGTITSHVRWGFLPDIILSKDCVDLHQLWQSGGSQLLHFE